MQFGELLSTEDAYLYLGGDKKKSRSRAFTRAQIETAMKRGIIRSVNIGGRYFAKRTDVDTFIDTIVTRGSEVFDAIPVG